MINKLLAVLVLLVHLNCYALQSNQIDDNQDSNLISLNFYQTDISIILQALADSKQMNLIMIDDSAIKQTIKLQNIEWQKALTIILNLANLEAEIDDNILLIRKATDPDIVYQQQLLTQKAQEQQQPLASLSLPINYAVPAELLTIIQQNGLLSERGKAIIDKRTNTLIINDLAKQFKAIKGLVSQLDKPLPQVHISAHIVTMSDESLSELGIKWGYSGNSSQLLDKFDVNLGVTNPATSLGFNLAKRSGSLLNLELSALESENQLEIIASPNLLTSNQNMASIKQGTEIPYEVSSGRNGATSIEFKQAVLGLEVTPKILDDKQMILDLYITQNTAGRSIKRSDGGEALAIDTQEIKTQVLVKSGETVVLGGIFQQVNSQDNRAVPGISKVPILGGLFKYDGKKQQKRELVIFITPQLVE